MKGSALLWTSRKQIWCCFWELGCFVTWCVCVCVCVCLEMDGRECLVVECLAGWIGGLGGLCSPGRHVTNRMIAIWCCGFRPHSGCSSGSIQRAPPWFLYHWIEWCLSTHPSLFFPPLFVVQIIVVLPVRYPLEQETLSILRWVLEWQWCMFLISCVPVVYLACTLPLVWRNLTYLWWSSPSYWGLLPSEVRKE